MLGPAHCQATARQRPARERHLGGPALAARPEVRPEREHGLDTFTDYHPVGMRRQADRLTV
ncbi:MAG: hypothetical protein AAGH90_02465 [Pseudomonadota bacterium]